jgi:acyl carrier protein phosphodiesterase
MNYLAHVYLSRHSPESLIGGLLGDFVKGRALDRYPPAVRGGIFLHRAIDRYTDAHEVVEVSRSRVSRERRRFAGIMVDVFYDHFLARHWRTWCATPLEDFTQQVYATLTPHRASFPERLQRVLPRMAGDDWLSAYREPWAVDAALNGIARRFKRFPRARVLTGGARELEQQYSHFEADFLAFFPELIDFVERYHTESIGLNAA